MTTYNKTTLKTLFETGDVPIGQDYADLIDSQVNIVETAVQTMAGPLSITEIITPLLSATAINCDSINCVGGLVSAANSLTLYAGNRLIFISSADRIDFTSGQDILTSAKRDITFNCNRTFTVNSSADVVLTATSGRVILYGQQGIECDTDVSANNVNIHASAFRAQAGFKGRATTPIVSAAGTTQGAATILTVAHLVRGQGSTDGSATGFAIPANQTGLVQNFIHEGAVSANLWPPTGGQINALGANAAFALAANTPYVIMHKSASAYAVK